MLKVPHELIDVFVFHFLGSIYSRDSKSHVLSPGVGSLVGGELYQSHETRVLAICGDGVSFVCYT